jgi:hypothetical protein
MMGQFAKSAQVGGGNKFGDVAFHKLKVAEIANYLDEISTGPKKNDYEKRNFMGSLRKMFNNKKVKEQFPNGYDDFMSALAESKLNEADAVFPKDAKKFAGGFQESMASEYTNEVNSSVAQAFEYITPKQRAALQTVVGGLNLIGASQNAAERARSRTPNPLYAQISGDKVPTAMGQVGFFSAANMISKIHNVMVDRLGKDHADKVSRMWVSPGGAEEWLSKFQDYKAKGQTTERAWINAIKDMPPVKPFKNQEVRDAVLGFMMESAKAGGRSNVRGWVSDTSDKNKQTGFGYNNALGQLVRDGKPQMVSKDFMEYYSNYKK